MARLDTAQTTKGDRANAGEYTAPVMQTDGVTGTETEWQNHNWGRQWGLFNTNSDLRNAINMKAIWTVGKGYTTNERNTVILRQISGMGKDTFDTIMFSLEVTKRIGGDAYAEIIRSEDGILINIKPLDPSTIKHIVDARGILIRYEQHGKLSNKKSIKKFQPKDMLHLTNMRLADSLHGLSDVDILEPVVKADEQSFDDLQKFMHWQAKPQIMFKIGTDNQAKINDFITKMEAAHQKGDNIYIPDDENAVDYKVIQVTANEVILKYRNELRGKFYRGIGLPQVQVGGSGGGTESDSKVIYLAHEQIVHWEQLELEQQLLKQLGIEITFTRPATLSQDLQNDEKKDGANAALTFQPSDTTAGVAE